VLLLDRQWAEELRVGRPRHALGATRPELEKPAEAALRVREHEVVLGRISPVVVVEARVHAAELGQAHRHVAVVEHDRDPVPLAQVRGNAAKVRHRHGEHEHRVGTLALDEPVEVTAPAGRHDLPDGLPREPVEGAVVGAVLGPTEVAVALEAGEPAPQGGVSLALAVGRVRRRPPPRRLDRAAAVRRDDEVDALLVEAFPELPPRGRAAVAEVEVDRRRDGEKAGLRHGRSV
jgi:hypothetical protein